MRDFCPWLPEEEFEIAGIPITQQGIILAALIVTTALVVLYRFITRRKRYHP